MKYPTLEEILSKRILLRSFVALNLVLLIFGCVRGTGIVPVLSRFWPGDFDAGFSSSGLMLLLALALLANVLTAMTIGFVVIFPALLDGVGIDERRVTRLLSDRAGISHEALEACLTVVHAEAVTARRRIAVGRAIIIGSAAALVFAFFATCMTLAHAPAHEPLFTEQSRPVDNAGVGAVQLWRFTGDQIAGALALDIPELYDFRFGDLDNNIHARVFTDFVFAFRALLGWVGLTSIIVTIRDRRSRPARGLKA